jgi:hypothetical protein
VSNPNHLVPISPEGLEIAKVYLETQDIQLTAKRLGIDQLQVTQYLEKAEVKNYVDQVYLNAGYRNRFRLAELMDQIIERKLSELQDADIGSSKDILEILQFAHKLRMDELTAQTKLEAARQNSVKSQTNIQINQSPYGDSNYGKLLDQLLNVDNK